MTCKVVTMNQITRCRKKPLRSSSNICPEACCWKEGKGVALLPSISQLIYVYFILRRHIRYLLLGVSFMLVTFCGKAIPKSYYCSRLFFTALSREKLSTILWQLKLVFEGNEAKRLPKWFYMVLSSLWRFILQSSQRKP